MNNWNDTVASVATAMQKMCLCIQKEWIVRHDLRWCEEKANQLSGAGFRLDWHCYGRVIIQLDLNHSPCLRMRVLSVLIRPLSATPRASCIRQQGLYIWKQHSVSSCHPRTSFFQSFFSSPHFTWLLYYISSLLRLLKSHGIFLHLSEGVRRNFNSANLGKKIDKNLSSPCFDWVSVTTRYQDSSCKWQNKLALM